MKKIILFVGCAFLFALPAFAQNVKPAKNDTMTELRAVYVRFLDASRLKNEKALKEIMTDDYSQVLPDGRQRTRDIRITETMQGNSKDEVLELKEFSARVYGDAAVAVCKVIQQHTDDGKTHWYDTWSTATFVKQKGKWRIAATHLSNVEVKAP